MSIKPFLEYLEKHQSDRGLFADLRHGFSEGTEYRAWPHIARFGCNLEDTRDRKIWTTIAAGFAIHKKTVGVGNFGRTLNRLACEGNSQSPDEALKRNAPRFNRLLVCNSAQEVCERLPGLIRRADKENIPINFERLYWDLKMWENPEREIKIHWAAQYWNAGTGQEKGEDDHVSDPNSD